MTELFFYRLSLFAGFLVILANALIALLAHKPKGEKYKSYNETQNIFGFVLLIWSGYILTHFILNVRYTNDYLAETISLSTYLFLVLGFEIMIHSMLDENYLSRKIIGTAAIKWTAYAIALTANYFFTPEPLQSISIILFSFPLFVNVCVAAYRSINRYIDVKRNIDNYYSDNTSEAVVWMRNCIFIMLALGFSCVVIPFGSALSDAVMTYAGVAIMTYLTIAMKNFQIAIIIDQPLHQKIYVEEHHPKISEAKIRSTEKLIDEWLKTHRFVEPNITIEDVATDIQSNRTYISEYINKTLNLTFKNWIALQKIEYSKTLLREHPEWTTTKVAEMVGYARSSYNKAFTKITGTTPNNWRQEQHK